MLRKIINPSLLFKRMFLTYSIIIFSVLSICIIFSYTIFSKNYIKEIEIINKKTLTRYGEFLENNFLVPTISSAGRVYNIISSSNSQVLNYNEKLSGNQIKLYNTYLELQAIPMVYNNDIIIYYKQDNLTVSSVEGVKFLNDKSLPYWYTIENDLKKSSFVSGVENDENYIYYLKTLPPNTTLNDANAIICIKTLSSNFVNIISGEQKNNNENLSVVNSNSTNIYIDGNENINLSSNFYTQVIERYKNFDDKYISYILKENKVSYFVSSIKIKNIDWYLINTISLDIHYKNLISIRNYVLLFFILSTFIGMILSYFFAGRFYFPLNNAFLRIKNILLLNKNKTLTSLPLDYDISKITSELENFEYIIKSNKYYLRHSFIEKLLLGRTSIYENPSEMFETTLVCSTFSNYFSFIILLEGEQFFQLSRDNKIFIIDDIVNKIEFYEGLELTLYITELSENKIGVIAGMDFVTDDLIQSNLNQIYSYIKLSFNIQSYFYVGEIVDNIYLCNNSYECALELQRLQFYSSGDNIFIYKSIRHIDFSQLNLTMKQLSEYFRLCDYLNTEVTLNKIAKYLTSDFYYFDNCEKIIMQINHIFVSFITNSNYVLKENEKMVIVNIMVNSKNIFEYFDFILSWFNIILNNKLNKTESKTDELINVVLEYIDKNFTSDISLDTASEHSKISARYLSKIFKSSVGINFTVYVNEKRLEYARKLLLSTALTVQEVSFKVGFNTPSYFISQFSSRYGVTPNSFKRQPHSNVSK